MNRVIKFRIWDEQEKTMPFVGFRLFGETTIFHLIDQYAFETKGEKDTLLRYNDFKEMQFIGLLDKNGMEIYEGDLIVSTGKVLSPYIVEWKDFHGWRLRHPDNKNAIWLADHVWKDAEVIGNIYENKNLLHD